MLILTSIPQIFATEMTMVCCKLGKAMITTAKSCAKCFVLDTSKAVLLFRYLSLQFLNFDTKFRLHPRMVSQVNFACIFQTNCGFTVIEMSFDERYFKEKLDMVVKNYKQQYLVEYFEQRIPRRLEKILL